MKEIWEDGRFLPEEGAEIPSLDGEAGLFETILVRGGTPVLVEAHVDRLVRSAAALGLAAAPDRAELCEACRLLPARCDIEEGRMRIAHTGHPGGRVVVNIDPFSGYPPEVYEEGAEAALDAEPGHPLGEAAGHKVLPYTPLLEARNRARLKGALDMIFWCEDGALLEGSASNVFVVKAGEVRTPPLSRGILPGVTRAAVLAAARRRGLSAQEADVFMAELGEVEEAFLTGSLMEIAPLRRVGNVEIPPGAVARELLGAIRSAH